MKTYTVKSGDSLASIARQHGLSDNWQPIWRYNAEVRRQLQGKDPNKIAAGATIFIPRTEKEYDESIERLRTLLRQTREQARELLRDVDVAKQDADRLGEAVDFAADIAMIGKGAVSAAVKLGSRRLIKLKLKKQALAATHKTIHYFVGLSGSSNEEIVLHEAGKATVDNSVMLMARRKFDSAKNLRSFRRGLTQAYAKKGAVTLAKVAGPAECADGLAEVISMVADLALDGLDAIKPSSVAKTWLWLTTGEHPDQTAKTAKKYIQGQMLASEKRLDRAIARLQEERQTVYRR